MNLVARIANALVSEPALLDLPRFRVLADVRARFGCGDSTAREAYALARIEAHKRERRDTWPYVRVAA